VKKLVEETPYSKRWICQILPEEYKLDNVGAKAKSAKNISVNHFTDITVSSRNAGSGKEEDEVERVRREVREFLETPEQQEMIKRRRSS